MVKVKGEGHFSLDHTITHKRKKQLSRVWWQARSKVSSAVPQAAIQTKDIVMAFGGNMGLGHQHTLDMITDPDMAPGSSLGPDIPMASGGSTDHSDQHVPLWQHNSQISTWSLVAIQIMDMTWPLVVTQATDTDTDPSCSRTTDPDMALEATWAKI